jgi:TRAP transporter 4TM/12TM fusion protein
MERKLNRGANNAGKALQVENYLAAGLSFMGILVSIIGVFHIGFFTPIMVGQAYYFWLMSFFLSVSFLYYFPTIRGKFWWYKFLLATLGFIIPFYFFLTAQLAYDQGWEFRAPFHVMIMALILVILVFVSLKEVGGIALLIVCLSFGFLPLFAGHLPDPFWGASFGFWSIINFHALGTESLVGLPMRVVGRLILGYLVFGAALQVTGGGKFFLDFALSILGKYRGGGAKVAITSSAFFGSFSGSVIANVITTGSFTIPTMKRTGYPPYYAAAVEACASTGGILMPPIMGAAAFIMTEFLDTSYLNVIIAAACPSLLYYLALFLQVDCYAAAHHLGGLPRDEIPSLRRTLKGGWPFILAFMVLIWLLAVPRLIAQAPYYSTALLLVMVMIKERGVIRFEKSLELIHTIGRAIANLTVILLGIGFVIGSLSMTGLAFTFASNLASVAGDNVFLLLLLGALSSYMLGMGMTTAVCYIFLAILVAPALVGVGLNRMASHLFFLYCGMISYITPPVALGAFAAASVAESRPMKTGFTAMRLGLGLWFLPFLFVLNPSLILEGPIWNSLLSFLLAAIGLSLIAQGAEGITVVKMKKLTMALRAIFIIVGGFIALSIILV